MEKMNKKIAFFIGVMLLLIQMNISVFAENITTDDFDVSQKGSISIFYQYQKSALKFVKFEMYQISSLDDKYEHHVFDTFDALNIKTDQLTENKYVSSLTDELDHFINVHTIEPVYQDVTDEDGKHKIKDLEAGMYYIQFEMTTSDDKRIYSEPSLVLVGQYDPTEKHWYYDHEVHPKFYVTDIVKQNIMVEKIWKNTTSDLIIPKEIKVALMCDGKLFEEVTLSKSNAWTYTWEDIDPSKSWAIEEITKNDHFTVSYSKDVFKFYITNTYTKPTSDKEIPDTGSIGYLVPICFSIGIICLLFGILMNLKVKNKING